MRKAALSLAAGLLLVAALSACNGVQPESEETSGQVYASIAARGAMLEEDGLQTADPEGAAGAIYGLLENASTERVSQSQLEEVFGLEPHMIVDAVAYLSDVTGGLCDIAIVRPAPGMGEQVREALSQYAVARAASFRNYDILGAYDIATNAAVFSQGEFIILLMLPDNEAAREIIDQYIPH